MIIDNNLSAVNQGKFALGNQKSKKVVDEGKVPPVHFLNEPDLKEAAAEMLSEQRVLGEFKDKKGLEQATDFHIGPDIRYALTSKNVGFLKRILWGPLTVGEYREVQYRIRELQSKFTSSNNILTGKLIDVG
jgi:hypothetical protein